MFKQPGKSETADSNTVATATRLPFFQPKLQVNTPDDPLEREADAVADKVMRMPLGDVSFSPASPSLQRRCAECAAEDEDRIHRKADAGGGGQAAPAIVGKVLSSGQGQPLDGGTRRNMEYRFKSDFSQVRIHTDASAAESARAIQAKAYTSGHDIVFGEGQFQPESDAGQRLLAHELVHVGQQRGQRALVQRATFQVGSTQVNIDYGNLITAHVGGAVGLRPFAEGAMSSYIGVSPLPADIATAFAALTDEQVDWMAHAIDILTDNTRPEHSRLDRPTAVRNVLAQAPLSTAALHTGDPNFTFEREVLRVSGWNDVALTAGLTGPTGTTQTEIQEILNPPPAPGRSVTDPLDEPLLRSRLIPALTDLLNLIDPNNRASVGSVNISIYQTIGDVILAEARNFFAPYADSARGNIFFLNPTWQASANIFDALSIASTPDRRIGYLLNRAEIVGQNTTATGLLPETNIFRDTNFDATRDAGVLLAIATDMDNDVAISPIVDRLVRHTGRKSGSGASTNIFLDTEYDSSRRTECEFHWNNIDTLCHEVLHALVHPNFQSSSGSVRFPQVIREGFTEALGIQLFNDRVLPKAKSDPAFLAQLEAGLPSAPCPASARVPGTIGYGDAGPGAEAIRTKVGDNNFRAAYFLGRTDLIGM